MFRSILKFSIALSLTFISFAYVTIPNNKRIQNNNNILKYSINEAPQSNKEIVINSAKNFIKSTTKALAISLFVMKAYADDTAIESSTVVSGPVFTTTESGLKYTDIKIGEGASPVPGDTVRVHYTGWLDGFESEKKFDSSYDRRSPLVFKVGVRQVIAGWDEALLTNMKVGTKRNVIIPPELGYGSRGAGGVIPPGATLYFTMELVGIGNR
mmetsp:Transcript_23541/g.21415  ORF Transcript_23541/g.21415 Transcript_23541/m.21415 type:complete len:212 (+) Transcript_23541:30-665(+)